MMNGKPLMFDFFCGLGGASEGFLAEGWACVGIDNERHDYGHGGYLGHLILQDILTFHGSQAKDAEFLWFSPPCQAYSYMAMPWSRAKKIAAEYRSGARSRAELNALFNACFRIQAEASHAAGRYIPLIVENVRGAQPWVGRSKYNYGSFHLWGDVPALMPITGMRQVMKRGVSHRSNGETNGRKQEGSGPIWFDTGIARHGSKSSSRKAASAQIAKIPFTLARHIARCFKPC